MAKEETFWEVWLREGASSTKIATVWDKDEAEAEKAKLPRGKGVYGYICEHTYSLEEEPRMEDETMDTNSASPFQTYYTVTARTNRNGTITATHYTNDSGDTGYPSEEDTWEENYPTFDRFRELAGYCRSGALGSIVTITLNGDRLEEVTEANVRLRHEEIAAIPYPKL